jgi:ubiquinone biosynthesis UbiH/UbiF/VisC/COQ6 family hydroxylase
MAVDICIRGAGIVGKTLALLLARDRVRVALVAAHGTHSHDPAHDIRSFALNSASKTLLQGLCAWPQTACAVRHMRVQGDDGGVLHFDAPSANAPSAAAASTPSSVSSSTAGEALAWIVDAAVLDAQLSLALSFQSTVQISTAPETAVLTVICEGKVSDTRAAWGVECESFSYGQTAIAAHVRCALPHQATAWQWMGRSDDHPLSQDGEVLALLPRHSADGGNSVALVWSVSHDYAAHLQALDDAAFCTQLQKACCSALGDMQLTSARASWPLQVSQALRWVGEHPDAGAWALAGDAAHTVHPLAGQGLNLGLADVAALAAIVKDKEYFRSYGDARLLRRYERTRKGDAAVLRTATDGLQRLFAAEGSQAQTLRNWGMTGFEKMGPLKAFVMRRAMGV